MSQRSDAIRLLHEIAAEYAGRMKEIGVDHPDYRTLVERCLHLEAISWMIENDGKRTK